MGKIKKHQQIVVEWLREYAEIRPFDSNLENILVTDYANGHFQIMRTGWVEGNQFIFNVIIHIQVKSDGKVWLLVNNTDLLIADELVERGISKNDIVIGFQHPSVRAYTGFAAA